MIFISVWLSILGFIFSNKRSNDALYFFSCLALSGKTWSALQDNFLDYKLWAASNVIQTLYISLLQYNITSFQKKKKNFQSRSLIHHSKLYFSPFFFSRILTDIKTNLLVNLMKSQLIYSGAFEKKRFLVCL